MKFYRGIESFNREFVTDLAERNSAIFVEVDQPKAAGYVNWPEPLSDIADELRLKVDREQDLVSNPSSGQKAFFE